MFTHLPSFISSPKPWPQSTHLLQWYLALCGIFFLLQFNLKEPTPFYKHFSRPIILSPEPGDAAVQTNLVTTNHTIPPRKVHFLLFPSQLALGSLHTGHPSTNHKRTTLPWNLLSLFAQGTGPRSQQDVTHQDTVTTAYRWRGVPS